MDKAKLEQLLEESQVPDTERVKAVTAELQKTYFSHAESILLLVDIAINNAKPSIRQQAAVQAQRISDRLWPKVPAQHRQAAIEQLLAGTLSEGNGGTRHSKSRLVAKFICHEVQDNSVQGPLLKNIMEMNLNHDVATRQVGSYIIYAVLENDPNAISRPYGPMFELFGRTIQDQQSSEVRVNTVKAVGAMLMLIDPEEDEDSIEAIQKLFPSMMLILKSSIETGQVNDYRDIFEVLQSFLAYDSSLLGQHLKQLIQYMLELAANTELEDDARCQALAFLTQCVHARRMKIQGMGPAGGELMRKAIQIVAELDSDEDEDEDELTPARTALTLIDQLSSDLPPRQVIVPLLDDFPKLAQAAEPGPKRAAILALGTAAEGSPDFISTQLKALMPHIVALLNDANESVRHAALLGLIHLADEMGGELASEHEALMDALIKNLEAATAHPSKRSTNIIRAACGALDSLGVELESSVMKGYAARLIPPLGALLNHEDYGIKSAAAGAIGAIALSLDEDFKPYFSDVMTAFGQYVTIKDSEDALALRSSVCDSMGRIAAAVGAEQFQPYVFELMKASEEGLHLDNPRLKETSFILWAALSKVYGEKFGEYLPGVFKGLLKTLELEEEEVALGGFTEDAAGGEVLVVGGKKLRIKKIEEHEVEDAFEMDDDDSDWADLDDFTGATAVALEQEIALEVLGDVISLACSLEDLKQYLEPTLDKVMPLTDHSFEGCRKAAISTLWRAYARVWMLVEEHTGNKWKPGLPSQSPMPDPVLEKVANLICEATLEIWANDAERSVVTEINRSAADTLKACGPAILGVGEMEKQIITVIASIITRSHPCQQDLGDEEDEQDVEGGSSEFDWLVIDTALDVVLGLAEAMGPNFMPHWITLHKPIIKFCSSQDSLEKSTSMGVVAEVIKHVGAAITPFTTQVQQLLLKRLTDPDPLTKSNTAYAMGQLIANTEDASIIRIYPEVYEKLEAALGVTESRMQDNIAGCLARMIMKKPDPEVVERLLPPMMSVLPLKEDYEENVPIFECIYKLYDIGNEQIRGITQQLIPIFETVLGPPAEQLEQKTREQVQKIVQLLYQHEPALFQNNPGALKLAGAL